MRSTSSRLRAWLLTLGLAAVLGLAPPATPAVWADDDRKSGNSAEAVNTKDGSSVFDIAFEIRRVSSGVVDHTNSAVAYASCAVGTSVPDSGLGFELEGPFALAARRGELPRADLRYTQTAGANQATVHFISSGPRAWVRVDGQAYELPPERVVGLRDSGGGGPGPLGELDVGSWTDDARETEGTPEAGEPTRRVRARADTAAALNDVIGVARRAAGEAALGGLRPLAHADASRVNAAVRSATVEVTSGARDRLLRRLLVRVEFALAPRELPRQLGRLSGAKVLLDLRVARPNRPVRVQSPAGALPYSALPRG